MSESDKYEELHKWARREINQNERWINDVILDLAHKLEDSHMPKWMICSDIIKALDTKDRNDLPEEERQNIVSETYIRKVLPEEYKDPSKVRKLSTSAEKSKTDDDKNVIEPMKITTSGEIDRMKEELENVKREVYNNNTVSETIQQEPIEPESLPANTVLPNELYEQLQEKDKKIDELRKGIQQSLVDKVDSRAQQEEIDSLKKQLQEARKMSENDIRVVEIDFQKFAGFINDLQSKEKPDDKYSKILLHVNIKTGKMVNIDAE